MGLHQSSKIVLGLIFSIVLFEELLFFPTFIPALFLDPESHYYVVEILGSVLRLLTILAIYWYLKGKIVNTPKIENTNINTRYVTLLALLNFSLTYLLAFIMRVTKIMTKLPELERDPKLFALGFYLAVFVAPIGEEILFRWCLFTLFDRIMFGDKDLIIKAAINAGLFGLIHYVFSGRQIYQDPIYRLNIPSWTFFGFFAFVLYYKTRNLKLCIILHSAVNFLILATNSVVMYTNLTELGVEYMCYVISLCFLIFWYSTYRSETNAFFHENREYLRLKPIGAFVFSLLVSIVIAYLINGIVFTITLYFLDFNMVVPAIITFTFLFGYIKIFAKTITDVPYTHFGSINQMFSQ